MRSALALRRRLPATKSNVAFQWLLKVIFIPSKKGRRSGPRTQHVLAVENILIISAARKKAQATPKTAMPTWCGLSLAFIEAANLARRFSTA